MVALKKGGTMKVQRVVFALMGMMLLFAGQSSAQQVKTDYDRNANFGQYKTYSWEKVQTKDPFMVERIDRKSTRLNSSHGYISYAVFCLKKKKKHKIIREHRQGARH